VAYYSYVLLGKDDRFYIGYTSDLKKRLQEHAQGRVSSTRFRRPLKLIHYEYFVNSKDARSRERFLKSGAGHEQMSKFLKSTLFKK